ncbi:trigger factor [secondary endosymbiont of Heteropsylla cubana]|uniref:Trigger factor n=2 Tax=secondary endosymbiont of Heteropsylla cubana TaxID=134287 RepID=J3VUJ3_9ENTR|nr:trigger factor [secondary endosymbiont of Heteropsylla cubana]
MQVSLESMEGLKRRVNITIASNILEEAVSSKLLNIAKTIRINGFRVGKAPLYLVVKRHEVSVRKEVLEELMKSNFLKSINRWKINPIGDTKYIPSEYKTGKDFSYSVEFEVYPEITLKGLDAIEIKKPIVKLKDLDIETMLDTLKKQQFIWKEITGPAGIENRVTIDIKSKINETKLKGSQSTDLVLVFGQNRMLDDFEKNIIGHNVGDTFDVTMTLPKVSQLQNFNKESIHFSVTLKKVEQKVFSEWNEALIKRFGIVSGSFVDLRSKIRKHMERELKNALKNYMKKQVINALLTTNEFPVPLALVNSEIDILRSQAENRYSSNKKHPIKLSRDLFEKKALRRVKVCFLLSEIVQKYQIKIDETLIINLIEEIAEDYEHPKKVIEYYYKNKELMNNIRNLALEQQAIEALFSNVRFIEKKMNFYELMQDSNEE